MIEHMIEQSMLEHMLHHIFSRNGGGGAKIIIMPKRGNGE